MKAAVSCARTASVTVRFSRPGAVVDVVDVEVEVDAAGAEVDVVPDAEVDVVVEPAGGVAA
jgi:hypothetical protein